MEGISEVSNSVTGAAEAEWEEEVSALYDELPGVVSSLSSGWKTGLAADDMHNPLKHRGQHHLSVTGPSIPESTSEGTRSQWVDNAVYNLDFGTTAPRAFELYGELFHVFISYRVKTEGSEGNFFASKLYHQLQMQSNGDDEFSIPAAGVGKYPRFARELPPGIAKKPHVAKVYLDTECLQDGREWMVGFVRGLAVSIVAVLLVCASSAPPPRHCPQHCESAIGLVV